MRDRNEPMTAAERMRRYRARQAGENVPKRRPGPPPSRPRDLSGVPLPQLLAEVNVRLEELLPVMPASSSQSWPHPSDMWDFSLSVSMILDYMGEDWDETAWLEGRDWQDDELRGS
jgi:hypothetical protein